MTKLVAIIGGVLLLAGVALAGTVSSLGSTGSPTIGSTLPTASLTVRQQTTTRGREAEQRGRDHEARHDSRPGQVGDDHGHHQRGRGSGGGHHGEDD